MRNAIALTGFISLFINACGTMPPAMPTTDIVPTHQHLLPPQTQDGGTSRQVAAIQDGQVYELKDFGRLLETNTITVTDANRELVARSFALMCIPNYLHGEMRFLSWEYIEDTHDFELGDEAVPLGVPPYSMNFYFAEQ